MATPYDGKVGLWHWQGRAIGEKTIDEVIATIKGWAPNVRAIWVKTSNGTKWQGEYWDEANKPDLAIAGVEDVERWVSRLEANGLEFHAWCVPKGRTDTLEQEAEKVVQVCLVPGVRSMVLDIEPYEYFWEGPKENVRKFMEMVRREIPGDFHIGMSMDPRSHRREDIYPDEWMPFVDSLHPQCYWSTFQRPVDEVLQEAYATWEGYGEPIGRNIPIIPALQGSAIPDDIEEAVRISIHQYGSPGVSYWRFGVIGPEQYPVINIPFSEIEEDNGGDTGIGVTIMVKPEDAAYADGLHTDRPEDEVWQVFRNNFGWLVKYTDTEAARSEVWARWDPRLPEPGRYEVSVFVPSTHATTKRARYKLHGIVGQAGEKVIEVDQSRYFNQWVSLGIFEFDPLANPAAGVTFLNDLTGESGRQIAFDAIRWRQITADDGDLFIADGFDSPVGTAGERASDQVWPGHWIDATGYNVLYRVGTPYKAYHTGADLNLNDPYWDADAHSPFYAVASGEVTFVGDLSGWGNVMVVKHDPLVSGGEVYYSRYAHGEDIRATEGDRVQRGEMLGRVGSGGGLYPYHLHFDIVKTDVLEDKPGHWPGMNRTELLAHYVNPRTFIQDNRPKQR